MTKKHFNHNIIYEKYSTFLGRLPNGKEYWRHLELGAFHARNLARLYFPAEKNIKILEIGCGWGHVMQGLRDLEYVRVEGVDVSAEQVEISRNLGISGIVHSEALAFLEDSKQKWDVIICLEVIEHLSKEEAVRLLSLCHSHLHAGGRLILRTLNCASPFFGAYAFGDFTHQTFFTETSLKQVLRLSGFQRVEVFPYRDDISTFKGLARSLLCRSAVLFLGLVNASLTGNFRSRPILTPVIEAVAFN